MFLSGVDNCALGVYTQEGHAIVSVYGLPVALGIKALFIQHSTKQIDKHCLSKCCVSVSRFPLQFVPFIFSLHLDVSKVTSISTLQTFANWDHLLEFLERVEESHLSALVLPARR
jgi:hypothetical protein